MLYVNGGTKDSKGFDVDMGDDLSDMLGVPTEKPVIQNETLKADLARIKTRLENTEIHTESCKACNGSGSFYSYTGRLVGPCFKCKGKGKRTFRTSAAHRQKAKENYQNRKEEIAKAGVEAFKENNPEMFAWIEANISTNNSFAVSLMAGVVKYGDLTENQKAAVLRAIEKAKTPKIDNRKEIDVSKIETAFNAARSSGLIRLKLFLDIFKFHPAGQHSRNPGAIYVTNNESGVYLGKIMDSKFSPSRDCDATMSERILSAASDPHNAAKAFGKQTGRCSCCGLTLTNPISIEKGIGPICESKYGW